MERFEGRVVAMTSAGAGIGEATARRLSAEGALLVVSDLSAERAARLADELTSNGAKAIGIPVNAGSEDDCARLIDTAIAEFGKLDVLVNVAGYGVNGTVTEVTSTEWHDVFSVVLDSVFYTSKAAIPHLLRTRGAIVNVASISGLAGEYSSVAYTSAKAGVANLTRSLALDYAAAGVRVNAVCPGTIATETVSRVTKLPRIAEAFAEAIPMGRLGDASEIASTIAFLASDDASYITGSLIVADGGVTSASGLPDMRTLGAGRGKTSEL